MARANYMRGRRRKKREEEREGKKGGRERKGEKERKRERGGIIKNNYWAGPLCPKVRSTGIDLHVNLEWLSSTLPHATWMYLLLIR